ncbi:coiled-coil domain-containing protein 150 [Esox lucius]|uniref:coiled-coil domain-containing protein 150 n=1 Tax=Esox lucius TaxID=8010 RepID=UPI0014777097|nr:coiled-coil domain-containing protein 150 [Esox lucius]
MSRSVIPPLDAGATAPEALSLLHQRLLMAEEQAEALVRDMVSLGVSREQILERVEGDLIQRPVSPLKMHHALREPGGEGLLWRQCDGLVSRVCRMESLLQTLKLATFRFSTERELDPSHSARLKEQISTLQRESEEEQRASRREVMRLRDQLRQAYLDRDKAQGEVQELEEALEVATASKMDVALAAEELKTVNVEMSEKVLQLKAQVYQECVRSLENEKSNHALLQRVEELEGVVEWERRQSQIAQANCHALSFDGQTTRQRLQEVEDRAHMLQEQCDQLKGQAEVKDSLVLELTGELKCVRLALQTQQRENSGHLKDIGNLKTTADQVLALNSQLECQCSELNSALRSLTMENSRLQTEHQASIKTERYRVSKQLEEQDLLLEAARRNIQAELQGALSDKVKLKMELETLKVDHNQLLQSSTVAQEKAVAQQELLECTIERLRGELTASVKEGEVMRQDRDSAKTEMCILVTKLEGEKNSLVTQLAKVKLDTVTFQKQEEENRRLMGKLTAIEHQQNAQLQVEQMLKELTDSKNTLAYENGSLQTKVDQLQDEVRELRDARAESVQQCKRSSVLKNKCNQVSSEMKTLKLTCQELEAQLRQAQGELVSAVAARNKALMDSRILRGCLDQLQERHQDKLSELEVRLGVSHQGGGNVTQTLESVLASHSRLQHNTETLQQELGGREQELVTLRLQAQRKIQRLQLEVQKLQDIMTTTHSEKTEMVESLRKALDVTRLDNKKLAQSLEQAVLANSTLQANFDQARHQYQNSSKLRESELLETRAEIGQLSERLETMKRHMKKERELAKSLSQREISELRKALEDSSLKSDDLSRANRELREKISELEKVVSNQKACLRDQKTRLRQHQDNRAALSNTKTIKASTVAYYTLI